MAYIFWCINYSPGSFGNFIKLYTSKWRDYYLDLDLYDSSVTLSMDTFHKDFQDID